MADPVPALTVQFLSWVAERPRSYGDAMDAWRTSCPRLSIWEDALRDGLVVLDRPQPGAKMRDRPVVITPRGLALLRPAANASRGAPARATEPAH